MRVQPVVFRYLILAPLSWWLLAGLSLRTAAQDVVVTVTLSTPDTEADEGDANNAAEIVLTLDKPLQFLETLGVPLWFSGGTLGVDFTLTKLQGDQVTYKNNLVEFHSPGFPDPGPDSGMKITLRLVAIQDNDARDDTVTVSIPTTLTDGVTPGLQPNQFLMNRGLPSGVRTGNGQIILLDDDKPAASFAAASRSAGEGAGTWNATVNISPALQEATTLNYSVGGTATPGTDYAALSGSVQASAGATSVDIPVSITDDSVIESDETVVLTLTSGSGYRLGSPKTHTLIIKDNDVAPPTPAVARFAAASSSASEGAGSHAVRVTLSPVPQAATTLNYSVGGTATPGTDYAALSGSVQASPGATSVDIPVSIIDDSVIENDETVVLTLTSGAGYKLGSPKTHTFTIEDDDDTSPPPPPPPPAVSVARFAAASSSASEGAGSRAVRVTLSPVPQAATTLNYSVGGTATPGTDYAALSGSVQASPGATSVDISVSIIDDSVIESDETVVLTLTSGAGYKLGSPKTHTFTIEDDDDTSPPPPPPPPAVSVARFAAASSSASEGAGSHIVRVTLSPVPQAATTLKYSVGGTATPGADYAALSDSVQALAGATSVDIPVSIIDDSVIENDETVVLTLTSGAGYELGSPNEHTLIIEDDDDTSPPPPPPPGVSLARFAVSSSSASEGAGSHIVRVTLFPVPQAATTLNYSVGGTATPGTDYAALSDSVQASAGATSVDIPVSIIDDSVIENDETVVLTLTSGAGYELGSPNEHTLIIEDDDDASPPPPPPPPPPGVSVARFAAASSSASEGAGSHAVRITLSPVPQAATTLNYSVGGTATRGTDYAALSDSVQASAGATSVVIPVSIIDDSVIESDETVVLTLTSGAGYELGSPNEHTLTIEDDDDASPPPPPPPPPPVMSVARFAAASSSASERAGSHNVMVNLFPVPQTDINLNYTVGGSATEGTDYTQLLRSVSVPPGAESVDIPVSITDDALDEGDETVELTIIAGADYELDSSSKHTFIIEEDDGSKTTARFTSGSERALATAGVQNATVNLSPALQADILLYYNLTGITGDVLYPLLADAVSVPAGATSATIPVTITNDMLDEGYDTVSLTLALGAGEYRLGLPHEYLFVIQDPAGPAVSVWGGAPVIEGEPALFMFTAPSALASSLPLNVTFTQTGDFGVQTGSLALMDIDLNVAFAVRTVDDNIIEPNGSVRLTLNAGEGYMVGALASAEVIIIDNDLGATSIESADQEVPVALTLEQNYPNPFNSSTMIAFSLPRSQRVALSVYDMLGKEVSVLMDGVRPAAHYNIAFDASDLASGTYLYVLQTEEQMVARTMALLK